MATILIVEDEPAVLNLIRLVLDREGYRTLTATDGIAGAAICVEQHPDLAVVDVVLPRQSGIEVARGCWEIAPDMPVLFISGYQSRELRDQGVASDFILQKPFRPVDLARRVDLLLRGRSPLPADGKAAPAP